MTSAEKEIRNLLAANVKLARHQLSGRVSQRKLAERLEVPQQLIGRWERAETAPSLSSLAALVDLTGHPPAWFFEDHRGEVIARLRQAEAALDAMHPRRTASGGEWVRR